MLTPSQQRALDMTRHLSVTANAGSGKTMVLVQRYLDILISGEARVHEIVAITFTEKAASELRRKVSEGIAAQHALANAAARRRLEEIRDQLPSAIVDTIHSLCSRLLREYPVEAGVDAAFTVLEGIDQIVMLDASVKEVFANVLGKEPGTPERENVMNVLRILGKRRVIDTVTTLAQKREMVGAWFEAGGLYTRPDSEILAMWRETIATHVASQIDDPQVDEDVRSIMSYAKGRNAAEVIAASEDFFAAPNGERRRTSFKELMQAMFTTTYTLRKKAFGSAEEETAQETARLARKAKSTMQLIDFLSTSDDSSHALLLSHSRTLLQLYQQVVEIYEDKKVENAQLDFDDLQIRTRNLLRDESVRRKLAQRFKYIMVDEYQDTNRLQYDILLPLVNELKRGNLFIVGDPKQSIYGFRDADVTVFHKTREDIRAAAGEQSAIVLGDSFRPLRDVAAFVNLLFHPLMSEGEGVYEVGYEPLILGRQNKNAGRVEIILHEEEEYDPVAEAELIARRIIALHHAKTTVYDKQERPRPVAFSDIAILLRTRKALPEIEWAFVRNNVPYLVTGGVGYFQTQSVLDFYNYFRFLLNHDDDTALFGILRSPFYTVSDAALFSAAFERKGVSLWTHLQRQHALGVLDARLQEAVAALREDCERAPRMNVPDLINHIIQRTAYAGFIAGSPRDEQTFANIEKLKRLARKYEEYGFTTLFDFVARLKKLIDEEPEEGQAAVDVLADAVKVMTIHAAKGLEFPVVFVPNLDRQFRQDSQLFLDRDVGMGLTFDSERSDQTPITEHLKRITSDKQDAEEKRIFYVACTRARDMLVLSGNPAGNKKSYMRWLKSLLLLEDQLDARELVFDVETPAIVRGENKYSTALERHELRIPLLWSADLPSAQFIESKLIAQQIPPRRLLDPLPSVAKTEIFSASKIRTYAECPSRYYLRYVLGLPDIAGSLFIKYDDDEQDVTIPADLRGRAFHHIMQHIDGMHATPEAIRAELKRFIGQDSLSVIAEPSVSLDELTDSVIRVLNSSFWKEVTRGVEYRTEFTLMAPLGNDLLTGTIDRVYRDASGVLNVVDYKTDAIAASDVKQAAKSYEVQLQFYALLAQRHFQVNEVKGMLFFAAPLKSVQYEFDSSRMKAFEKMLSETIARIHRGEFDPPTKPCDGCPFLPRGCNNFMAST